MIGYRCNFLTDTFAIGITLGDMHLDYAEGDREHLIGLSLYLGIMAIRVGYIRSEKGGL